MCGLAGAVFTAPDERRLRRALDALAHRGPDGSGIWLGRDVALGHRRLAVIDLSARANQPMTNEDETVRVVFNGEIYNFKSLRTELEGSHRFVTSSDTEVLLHGYEEWGI